MRESPVAMSEGLFPLGGMDTPFDQTPVASGTMRVWTPVYFLATVFPDAASRDAFGVPPPDRPMSSGRKVFLDEGVVLWNVSLAVQELVQHQDDLSPPLV